ncbi:hypothetical protein LCGC14_2673050, partial [marine sediment metagenome]
MTFYSFPRLLRVENPRDIRIPIVGRITVQSIIDEAEDILTAPPSMAIMVIPGANMEQASAIQRIVNQWGFGLPVFRDDEEMRAWYRQMGLE